MITVIDQTLPQEAESDAAMTAQAAVTVDYFGTKRPLGAKLDIGAQEAQ